MSHCELRLAPDIADGFARVLERTLKEMGYPEVFEFCSPDGTQVTEFRQGEVTLTVSLSEQEGYEQLDLDSDQLDCPALVRKAAVGTEMLTGTLGPSARLPAPELEAAVREGLEELARRVA